jgi:hypothetical protein
LPLCPAWWAVRLSSHTSVLLATRRAWASAREGWLLPSAPPSCGVAAGQTAVRGSAWLTLRAQGWVPRARRCGGKVGADDLASSPRERGGPDAGGGTMYREPERSTDRTCGHHSARGRRRFRRWMTHPRTQVRQASVARGTLVRQPPDWDHPADRLPPATRALARLLSTPDVPLPGRAGLREAVRGLPGGSRLLAAWVLGSALIAGHQVVRVLRRRRRHPEPPGTREGAGTGARAGRGCGDRVGGTAAIRSCGA